VPMICTIFLRRRQGQTGWVPTPKMSTEDALYVRLGQASRGLTFCTMAAVVHTMPLMAIEWEETELVDPPRREIVNRGVKFALQYRSGSEWARLGRNPRMLGLCPKIVSQNPEYWVDEPHVFKLYRKHLQECKAAIFRQFSRFGITPSASGSLIDGWGKFPKSAHKSRFVPQRVGSKRRSHSIWWIDNGSKDRAARGRFTIFRI